MVYYRIQRGSSERKFRLRVHHSEISAIVRYATQSQLDDHQRLHSAVRCPRCGVVDDDEDDGSGAEDVAHHYKGKHEVTCMLCKCQVRG